jgi:hypothetical protein
MNGLQLQIESLEKQIKDGDQQQIPELRTKLERAFLQKTVYLNQQIEQEQTLRELDERT